MSRFFCSIDDVDRRMTQFSSVRTPADPTAGSGSLWENSSENPTRGVINMYLDRPTFSQRRGRGPRSSTLTYERFREYLVAMVEDLFAQDYLQQAFGYQCVDQGV